MGLNVDVATHLPHPFEHQKYIFLIDSSSIPIASNWRLIAI
jgi:hypothetical protein